MKATPDEIAALARLAESRGGKALGIGLPDAAPTVPALAPGRHEFTVEGWRPSTINELTKAGGHWATAHRLKRRDRNLVALHSEAVPKAIRKRRVSVEVIVAGRMRFVDPDALQKSTLDALVAAGLLVDDSSRWVELGPVTQIRGTAKATRVVLEDMEDA